MSDAIEYEALVPLGDRILCRPDPLTKTHGLIERPEIVYQRAHSGTIVAMGQELPAEKRRGLKIGDHIGWGPHAGVELRVRGETHYLLDIDEPWGRITDGLP